MENLKFILEDSSNDVSPVDDPLKYKINVKSKLITHENAIKIPKKKQTTCHDHLISYMSSIAVALRRSNLLKSHLFGGFNQTRFNETLNRDFSTRFHALLVVFLKLSGLLNELTAVAVLHGEEIVM
ncbi:CLUMA_CG001144, isoform A [Clunio marinus]|uniref:CLUMA_CG001144, isoform A n=1 Tax=Clunio marinus TaxID=568069 RepID=A0A1J1HLL1_9DIPT|nr:CLUMA_CG001144, isoform A [Clunio marinus]